MAESTTMTIRSSLTSTKMKKSQITLFVIVGIVILIVFGLASYYYGAVKQQKPFVALFEEDYNEKIDQQFRECLSIISDPIIDKTIRQGGYFEEEGIPENYVYDGSYYTTSYDTLYPGYGIADSYDLKIYLEEKIHEGYWDCMYGLRQEMTRNGKEFYLTLNNLNVNIFDEQVFIEYEYDSDVQNFKRTVTSTEGISTNVGYFLNKANYLTTEYVYTIGTVDTLLNYQICQELKDKYSITPYYYTDFFKELSGNPNIIVKADYNFFIIKLIRNNELFAFAIRPETINPLC